ncbi:MAG: oligogalacturonate lyase family protein [Bryobacteraceae bacterium]|jgi:oligogalacturonide lyase
MGVAGHRKGATFPSEWRPYADAVTELTVYRLTDPAYSSVLPAYFGHAVSRNSAFLLFACDRSGAPQAFGMNLKTGATTQLTDAEGLDASGLALLPGDRSFCYVAGRAVFVAALANLRERAVYTVPEPWAPAQGLSVDSGGTRIFLVERQGDRSRLRAAPLVRGEAHTVLESPSAISDPIPRPRRAQILYRRDGEALWLAGFDGAGNRQLRLAPGRVGPANWAPDGSKILYLSVPEDPARLREIREFDPDTNGDALVAKTSQYAHFGFNHDTSVFVGASRSAASPVILIMLRVNGRELTLCEHKASRPEAAAPLFAPDAQHIYFQSDRDGKPALYSMNVDRLVAKIEEGSQ